MKCLALCLLVMTSGSYARQLTINNNEDAIWTVELRWREQKSVSTGIVQIRTSKMVDQVKVVKVLPADLGPKAKLEISGMNVSFSPGTFTWLAVPQGFVAIKITQNEVGGVARTEKDSRGRNTGVVVYREGEQTGRVWSGCLKGNGDATIGSLQEPIFGAVLQLAPDGQGVQCPAR
ncbi:MAG TPA: hypothetical protein VLG71_03460 [Candidatus Limnocylindria bacterium]|nr:hypothetical protein [Candidatus Limnocylindria bacterium]